MEQYQQLVNRVAALQELYEGTETQSNLDRLVAHNMTKRLSVPDPMAIIQLSERLHSVEIALGNMLGVLHELASRTPGVIEAVGTLEAIPGIFTPPSNQPPYLNVLPNVPDTTLEVIPVILSQNQPKPHESPHEVITHELMPRKPSRQLHDYTLNEVKIISILDSIYDRLGLP